MENPWRAPVVAVEAGRVKYWESSLGGCMLYHYGASGTTYMYIHLNNDLTARNDNRGGCKKDVALRGSQRRAGLGGPADRVERRLRRRRREPRTCTSRCTRAAARDVNPYRHLKAAVKPLFAAKLGSHFSLGLRGERRLGREGQRAAGRRGGEALPGRALARDRPPARRPRRRALDPRAADLARRRRRRRAAAPSLRPQTPVVAYTPRARTTEAALVGATGALKLQRVVRR